MHLVSALFLLAAATLGANAQEREVAYYSSWATYRIGDAKFDVLDIDPTLVTHIVYSFAGLQNTGEINWLDPWNDVGDEWHAGQIQQLQLLKKVNPNVKIILAVGGYTAGPTNFQAVCRSVTRRAIFIDSAYSILQQYELDGLDIDWEYYDQTGGTAADKTCLTSMLNEFKAKFNGTYSISIATPASFTLIDNCYELDKVSAAVDFINVMAYDFHGSWDAVTGHVTPLRSAAGPNDPLSVESLINYMIKKGAEPSKINLGLITYGRTYTLASATQHGVGAPSKGAGAMGTVVPEAGILAYTDICLNNWTQVWDDTAAVPYAYQGDQWVTYDNPDSLAIKVEFGRSLGLGGYMVWSLETDDFRGSCGGETYPLVRAINKAVKLHSGIEKFIEKLQVQQNKQNNLVE